MELRLDDNNLLDIRSWIEGGIGSTGIYTQFTTNCINERIVTINPFNNNDTVWKTYNNGTTGVTTGGYYVYANSTNNIIYDDTKTYRYSIWVKRKVSDTTGSLYFGGLISNSGNTNIEVKTIKTGTASSGRYFCWISNSNMDTYFPIDEWKLMVAHMFPFAWTGTTNHDNSGVWKLDGTKLNLPGDSGDATPNTNDGVWNGERIFAPWEDNVTISTSGMSFELIYPRIDVVDGTEPSISELLSGLTYKLNSGGTYYDVGSVKIKKDDNLLDYSDWSTDASGSTTYFTQNGKGINTRILDVDPFNNSTYIWKAYLSGSTTGEGGWKTKIQIDNNKTYRYSFWVNRYNDCVSRFYSGFCAYSGTTGESVVKYSRLASTYAEYTGYNGPCYNVNFTSSAWLPVNEWMLVVFTIYKESQGITSNTGGIYYTNGTKIATLNDFIMASGTTYMDFRNLSPYTTATGSDCDFRFVYPRIDVVDGTEPSIETLLTSEGTYLDVENIKLKKDNNLLDYSHWSTYASGSTTYFTEFGGINTRILDVDPFNNNTYLWQGSGTSSGTSAGWQSILRIIDHTKMYRSTVWVKRIGGTLGRYYFGYHVRNSGGGAMNSKRVNDGLKFDNFYYIENITFSSLSSVDFPEDTWRLLVGYIFPSSYTGSIDANYYGRLYDRYGNSIRTSNYNYMFLTGTTYLTHRIYAPYWGDSTYKMAYPRIDVVDGTEPSITTLLTSEGVWLDAKTFNKNEEF